MAIEISNKTIICGLRNSTHLDIAIMPRIITQYATSWMKLFKSFDIEIPTL